jgi:hypothetical protein
LQGTCYRSGRLSLVFARKIAVPRGAEFAT